MFNEKYFERVIHHELFHVIYDGFKELFNDDEWKKFNDKILNMRIALPVLKN
jgi:predicted SprT family Zn-dependent metalloprotease